MRRRFSVTLTLTQTQTHTHAGVSYVVLQEKQLVLTSTRILLS